MPDASLWVRAVDRLGISPGSRVLAVCMSAEPVLAALAARGAEVHAWDWHCSALREAARLLPPDRVQPWDGTTGGPAGLFDAALCDLAHLSGRFAFTEAVRLAVRALRPGGRLLVRGGNVEGVGGAGRRLAEWFGVAEPIAYGGGARILACTPGLNAPVPVDPPEAGQIVAVELGGVRLRLHRSPGLFAEGLPDAATRLLGDTLGLRRAGLNRRAVACDVGCGGGALGLCLLGLGIARCVLVDENLRAVASAGDNLRLNGLQARGEAVAADAAEGIPGAPYDLIVCNPPFHAGPHEDRDLGRAIVRACWAAAAPGGLVFVVSHGFLRYERDVPQLRALASADGFTVRLAVRPARPSG